METPIKKEIVDRLVAELGITDFAKATIREVKQVAAKAEKASGVEFIKMEMGIPGLPAAQVLMHRSRRCRMASPTAIPIFRALPC